MAVRNSAEECLFELTFFMLVVGFRLAVLNWCFPGGGFQSKWFSGCGKIKKDRK